MSRTPRTPFSRNAIQDHPNLSCGFYYLYRKGNIDIGTRDKWPERIGINKVTAGTEIKIYVDADELEANAVKIDKFCVVQFAKTLAEMISTDSTKFVKAKNHSVATQQVIYVGEVLFAMVILKIGKINGDAKAEKEFYRNVNIVLKKVANLPNVNEAEEFLNSYDPNAQQASEPFVTQENAPIQPRLRIRDAVKRPNAQRSSSKSSTSDTKNSLNVNGMSVENGGNDDSNNENHDINNVVQPPAKKAKTEEIKNEEEESRNESLENETVGENINNENTVDGHPELQADTNVKEELQAPQDFQSNNSETLNVSNNAKNEHETDNSGETKETPALTLAVAPSAPILPSQNDQSQVSNTVSDSDSSISFGIKTPSEDIICATLQKLDIPFIRRDFLYFWAEVLCTEVHATSSPSSTYNVSSSDNSFFKCISLFFTGKEEHYYFIKAGFQAYVYKNFKTFGIVDGIDFSKIGKAEFQAFHECNKLTSAHFNLISSWLKCRVGIFTNGLEKFGNLKEETYPVLIVHNENGFYKPVLTLI